MCTSIFMLSKMELEIRKKWQQHLSQGNSWWAGSCQLSGCGHCWVYPSIPPVLCLPASLHNSLWCPKNNRRIVLVNHRNIIAHSKCKTWGKNDMKGNKGAHSARSSYWQRDGTTSQQSGPFINTQHWSLTSANRNQNKDSFGLLELWNRRTHPEHGTICYRHTYL